MALPPEQLFSVNVDALADGDKCEIAKSRWRSAHLFKNFFWGLLALLCLALVAAVVTIIALLFVAEDRDTERLSRGSARLRMAQSSLSLSRRSGGSLLRSELHIKRPTKLARSHLRSLPNHSFVTATYWCPGARPSKKWRRPSASALRPFPGGSQSTKAACCVSAVASGLRCRLGDDFVRGLCSDGSRVGAVLSHRVLRGSQRFHHQERGHREVLLTCRRLSPEFAGLTSARAGASTICAV